MWQSAGAGGVSYGLAPPDRRAASLSVYNLGPSAASCVASGAGTGAVITPM